MTTKLLRLFLILVSMICFACHEGEDDLLDAGPQPLVQYVITVVDSATGVPLDEVEIEVTKIDKDKDTYYTDSNGQIRLDEFESSRNLFYFSKDGYEPLYMIDSVRGSNDSIFSEIPI